MTRAYRMNKQVVLKARAIDMYLSLGVKTAFGFWEYSELWRREGIGMSFMYRTKYSTAMHEYRERATKMRILDISR